MEKLLELEVPSIAQMGRTDKVTRAIILRVVGDVALLVTDFLKG